MSSNKTMKPVPVSLPNDLRKYADKQSARKHLSLAGYIRELIKNDKASNDSA